MGVPSKVCWVEGWRYRHNNFNSRTCITRRACSTSPPRSLPTCGSALGRVDSAALANSSLQARAISLIFQDGEVYKASATEKLPPPIDLRALPAGAQQFSYYAALPCLNTFGDNLSRSSEERATAGRTAAPAICIRRRLKGRLGSGLATERVKLVVAFNDG